MTNCPRCNMYVAPGAQFCPNCNLDLMQARYQQQSFGVASTTGTTEETRQEKIYRKAFLFLAIFIMGEFALDKIPELVMSWTGTYIYQFFTPLSWVTQLVWSGIPLLVALVLPKDRPGRVLLIVFASIYAVWHLGSFIYNVFFYEPDPSILYQF